MGNLEKRAIDFGEIVREILNQFQHMHDLAAGGQHANLGPQDLRLVELLGDSGPQMMRSLAEHVGLAVNSMTSLVDGLEQRGLAHRTRSQTDRRVVNVDLTDEGKQAYEFVKNAKTEFHRALLSALSEEEQEILLVLFRKIAREGSKQVQQHSSKS
ncbi:MAG: MarR family transcriptional regulator [Pirellula sp.]